MRIEGIRQIDRQTIVLARDLKAVVPPGRFVEGGQLFGKDKEPQRDGEPNIHGNDGRDGRDKPDFKVELLCRTFVGDSDARPLAPGIVFWESPDIWVEGVLGVDRPQAGVSNDVKVHVWNVGLADSSATFVDVYWCNPSVGINAASANAIGSQTISLNAGEHKVLTFPWTPGFANGGHECLVAQVYDPLRDPLIAPFNPMQDRHVAQRNVTVVQAPAGKKVRLDFSVPNLARRTEGSTLTLERLQGDGLQSLALTLGRNALASAPGARAGLTEPKFGRVQTTLNIGELPALNVFRETLQPLMTHNIAETVSHSLHALVVGFDAARPAVTPAAPPVVAAVTGQLLERRELRLPPGQQAALGLEVETAARARIGTVQAYRVVERVNGEITGGVTFLVETVA